MKLNTPLPQPLPSECAKAAQIFKSFVDGGNNGLDGVIPRSVLENAKGFAIFTIFKAGFLFSARAGSGIVIAKLEDGSWSAPSAIGTAGLGVGGQAGAEMTDFLIVLNSRSAVRSFMSAGSFTLGGNLSLALGPLGRTGEASGSLSTSGKVAAMYSYSKTRGLFGGVSVEGSVIVERQDANALAYKSNVTAKMLLTGAVDRPEWANSLIKTLDMCTGLPGNRKWVQDGGGQAGYAFAGLESPKIESSRRLKKTATNPFPPKSWGEQKDTGSYFSPEDRDKSLAGTTATPRQRQGLGRSATENFETQFDSDFNPDEGDRPQSNFQPGSSRYEFEDTLRPSRRPQVASSLLAHARSISTSAASVNPFTRHKPRNFSYSPSSNPFSNSMEPQVVNLIDVDPLSQPSPRITPPYITPKPGLTKPMLPGEGIARAIALYDFAAVESGDLSFSKGDVIIITQKSDSSEDWWTGKLNGREGIFPANFIELV